MKTDGDRDVETYPKWTEVGDDYIYDRGNGLWTKKEGFTYLISDRGWDSKPPGTPYLLYRITTPTNNSIVWKEVLPGLYDILFEPGEIEQRFMEMLL